MLVQSEAFEGGRLLLAREFWGKTQKELGAKVATSEAFISHCENGKKVPTPEFVKACAEELKLDPSFFYRRIDDLFSEKECSFRHRRSTPEKAKAQIRAHATLLGMVVDRLRTSFRFPAINIPKIPVSSIEEIEKAAKTVRLHWGLGNDAPILQVGRALERAGVIIVRHFVKSSKVDAFSRDGKTTVIFLNEEISSPSRWNFDIGHECGHLVMHSGMQTGNIETETQADRFASAFLMPSNAFAREFRLTPFSWPKVFDLKRRWHTSAAAIIRRAYDLHLIGAAEYRRHCQYMSYKGWRKEEPCEPAFQNPELLETAFAALGRDVELTMETLCSDLGFSKETFREVTGQTIPTRNRKRAQVLEFKLET
jgi:Zn-dependent peptidase ImmA (M78 family)/DNA-binding XRE family transcriptional regulator